MNEREIEQRLRQAYASAAPDVLSSVLSDCGAQKGTVIMIPEKRRLRPLARRTVAVAAALLLVFGGLAGYGARAVDATVSFDVNPSLEISLNRAQRVLAVTPLNGDASALLDGMDFSGSTLDVAVHAVIGAMVRSGDLNAQANSILISVDARNADAGAALRTRLTEEVRVLLDTGDFTGAVLSQTVQADDAAQALADEYGITRGKALLVRRLADAHPLYDVAALARLSVNELNLLLAPTDSAAIAQVGTASELAYIGAEKALSLALAHAGVAPAAARRTSAGLELDDGRMVYDVEFDAGGYEYDYELDAATGAVLQSEKERDDDAAAVIPGTPSTPNTPNTPSTPTAPSTPTTPATGTALDEAAVRALVLAHAGVAETAVTGWRCETDRDDGRTVWDVGFDANGYEYDYELDAATGAVLQSEKERDDDAAAVTPSTPTTPNTPSAPSTPVTPTASGMASTPTAPVTPGPIDLDDDDDFDLDDDDDDDFDFDHDGDDFDDLDDD